MKRILGKCIRAQFSAKIYLNLNCQDRAFDLVDAVCGRYGRDLQLAGSHPHGRRQVKAAGEDGHHYHVGDNIDDDDKDPIMFGMTRLNPGGTRGHVHGRD